MLCNSKNTPRTLETVARVCQKIMATLYDTYFPGAEALRPGPISQCPNSNILTIVWLLELIGKDSKLAGYKLIKAQLGHLFPHLPERSRFNRRRRNLCLAISQKCKQRAGTGTRPYNRSTCWKKQSEI